MSGIYKSLTLVSISGMLVILSAQPAKAQCSGGGRNMPSTGSNSTLASLTPYGSTAMNFPGYPSSTSQMANSYQQRVAMLQNQIYGTANQLAAEQRRKREEYLERVRPFRLARAEAKREAYAARAAARLAEQGSEPSSSRSRYSLTSTHPDKDADDTTSFPLSIR
ncbi:hypothetical protein [Novipirellula artificiosorum]|uniref:Uncharacterized protein n=1 Tax=Novipirellula artificiosorum TaxID=2528016 RepID=A0A5C6CWN8_9BACT|nr:hypothetical protein [Novipirellula artificiosorum]TWU28828.1 hypothetical protein Poly41_68670 [Novipirellula artificiosorum]